MKKLLTKLLSLNSQRFCSYKPVRRPNLRNDQRKTNVQIEKNGTTNTADSLSKQLRARILATGPVTVADYMREVLTNPLSGYYMHRDVFGREGDFVTSPEISQIFGELIGIWLLTEWQKLGSPSPFQLVELGPGRGSLSRDVLRVLSQFKLGAEFSLHLVEISPFLSKIQAQRICFNHQQLNDDSLPYYQTGETATGTRVYWHKQLDDVPKGFSLILAHEFVDALPVHKLQLVDNKWHEILIDVNDASTTNATEINSAEFRFVLSNAQTPLSRVFKPLLHENRECLEYSIEADVLIGKLCARIERDGGIALIMDYGHFGNKTDTFRAFKEHQLHDPLKMPGTADLTADVDFKRMKHVAESSGQVVCFGPIEQGLFLQRMQGEARLQQLMQNALPDQQKLIQSGYEMLTQHEQMGERFKFFSMFPATVKQHLQKYPVNGFT